MVYKEASITYGIEYEHDGSTWIAHVQATSEEDLWQRIERMRDGRCLGTLEMVVPVGVGWFATLFCWVQNLLHRLGTKR